MRKISRALSFVLIFCLVCPAFGALRSTEDLREVSLAQSAFLSELRRAEAQLMNEGLEQPGTAAVVERMQRLHPEVADWAPLCVVGLGVGSFFYLMGQIYFKIRPSLKKDCVRGKDSDGDKKVGSL